MWYLHTYQPRYCHFSSFVVWVISLPACMYICIATSLVSLPFIETLYFATVAVFHFIVYAGQSRSRYLPTCVFPRACIWYKKFHVCLMAKIVFYVLIPASFCLDSFFSHYNFNNTNWKSIDCVLGIQTRDRRMVGAVKTTELWWQPCI